MLRKLFLDDVRPAPFGWGLARDYENFCSLVDNFDYDLISFDHDLAPEHYPGFSLGSGYMETSSNPSLNPTGLDCARYVIAKGKVPRYVVVHSMNPVGAERIVQEFTDTTAVIFREVYSVKASRVVSALEAFGEDWRGDEVEDL